VSGYLLRRILEAVVVVVLVSLIVFLLIHLLPGGPARAILGPRATGLQIARFNHEYGFDRPVFVQYAAWADHILHGDLGFSFKLNQSVTSLLAERLPKTLVLTGLSTLLALVVAVPLGMVQAVRRNTLLDYTLTGAAIVFYATPAFFIGILLILAFSVTIQLFPAQAPQGDIVDILTTPSALVLPVMSLALLTVAEFSRYMRSSVLDNVSEDYVRTARAKGAGEQRILYRHVLRNALIPIATLAGLNLPVIFSGALITEAVFNFPGMGYLFWTSAQQQDYPVLLGFTLVVSITTVLGSLLADLAYAVLDPRVRYVRS
jgi:peptide/nickel transport system permease protein